MHKVYNQYRLDIEQSNYLPQFKHLEEFRVKRYLTGGDERFDEHVDVTDTVSSARALAFLVYLNENDGNTLFPSQNLNIEPISGRVIVFPPTWEYPHEGLAPKSNPKYIIVTVVDEGGSGSAVAAPVSRRIIQHLLGYALTPVEFGEITE